MMFLKAFIVGGLICVIGQLLIDLTKLTPAKILVLFVCVGVLLGGLGIYQHLIDFAGAGATVPLTGFGASLAKGVKEAIQKDGFLGVVAGPLQACAVGVTVAMLSALAVALICRPKDKGWVNVKRRQQPPFSYLYFKLPLKIQAYTNFQNHFL